MSVKMSSKSDSEREAELRIIIESEEPIDFNDLRAAADGRPLPSGPDAARIRARAWQALLGVANKQNDGRQQIDVLYNLPEQEAIRKRCNSIFDALDNQESERLAFTSTLESLLTQFCKTRRVQYSDDNGWADVLQLLCTLQLPLEPMYNLFDAIITKYVPRGCRPDGRPFDLFRLLLLYHEPSLCSFLDTRNITPDLYAQRWFTTLFAAVTSVDCVLPMWDIYFQHGDPFFIFFMALTMLVKTKGRVMSLRRKDQRQEIIDVLASIPAQLSADSIEEFCRLAQQYTERTPQSFRRDYHGPLFGSNLADDEFTEFSVHSLLCLPVSVQELLNATKVIGSYSDGIHYFVVDARPTEQFMAGHLPGAFNLDATLLVDAPEDYEIAEGSLQEYKERTWPNAHLCFMGVGDDSEEDARVHMVVSQFLQRHEAHVSLARGGYNALHEMLRESLSTRLKSHSTRACTACHRQQAHTRYSASSTPHSSPQKAANHHAHTAPATPSEGSSLNTFLGRFKGFKSMLGSAQPKFAEMKNKVLDYVVGEEDDEMTFAPSAHASKHRHVKPSDRHGKAYRNMESVFAIADDDDDEESTSSPTPSLPSKTETSTSANGQAEVPKKKHIQLSSFCVDNDIKPEHCFDAQFVEPDTKLLTKCMVVLSEEHLYILYPLTTVAENKCDYEVSSKRSLRNVHKITCKRAVPELLTIRYGYELSHGDYKVTGVDRLLVPKSGDLAKAMKTAVVQLRQNDAAPEL